MNPFTEQITELNLNYNLLGEDLVMLEAVLRTDWKEAGFPKEFTASSLTRITDYIQQHTETISQLSEYLAVSPTAS